MACIQTTNFSIIINGFLAYFFRAYRGLHQRCALSPLLFILVMECLSSKLREEKDRGRIKAMKVSKNMNVTPLMFVDDLLFGGMDENDDWEVIHQIIMSFSEASRLCMNT